MPTVKVVKVYNNNVILAQEADGLQVVLMGKGIGFSRRTGDLVDETGCKRFVPDSTARAESLGSTLGEASWDEAQVAGEICSQASRSLDFPDSQGLFVPVLDHLVFAVRRAQKGTVVDFGLKWEVEQLYPEEAEEGRKAVELVKSELGFKLQEDEWVAFAMHFISHRWAGGDMSRTVAATQTISDIFNALEHVWGRAIPRSSMSASRFVTHLRYLFARVRTEQQLPALDIDLLASVRASCPPAVEAAETLAALISEAAGRPLSKDEVSYLALHTSRLYAELE
jgi:beta-glucoside operon transcriptional antiterminator